MEDIARHHGGVLMEVYGSDFEVRGKADRSPVSAADERAEARSVPALQALRPGWPSWPVVA